MKMSKKLGNKKGIGALGVLGISLGVMFSGSISNVAVAQSVNDRCDVWLCVAGAFAPSACGSARSHFFKKIRKGRNPFPAWSSCIALPELDPELKDYAEKKGLDTRTNEPIQPYDASYKTRTYINNGKTKSEIRYSYSSCPRSGQITEIKSRWNYREEWLVAICNVSWVVDLHPRRGFEDVWEFGRTFRDHERGKTYDEVMNGNFEPVMLRRWRVGNKNDR